MIEHVLTCLSSFISYINRTLEKKKNPPELQFESKPIIFDACQLVFSTLFYNSVYFLH